MQHATLNNMKKFEADIAYFYGAKNTQPIIDHYLQALQYIDIACEKKPDHCEQSALLALENAYQEIYNQTNLCFDIQKAAIFELELILAQKSQADFDSICDIMMNLYEVVFKNKSEHIYKAAMIRTFLYKFKTTLEKREVRFSLSDLSLLTDLAQKSERLLNNQNGVIKHETK